VQRLLFCLTFLCLGCSGAPIQPPPVQGLGFYTTLRQNKNAVFLDVFFRNPTEKTVELMYGDWNCAFRFELWVNSKKYTYPPKQLAGFSNPPMNLEGRICHSAAAIQSVNKKSTLRFNTIRLSLALAQALRNAKMKFSGAFHFAYWVTGQPPKLEVYKIP
jgi:hypothetical protein